MVLFDILRDPRLAYEGNVTHLHRIWPLDQDSADAKSA